ncbi:hypothetical protein NL108_007479 [Boleophthalmus pectinirostris]|uniref:TIMELESS-interacting protein n=1 Tax=Boleophthalmus pectinirostris TaxID=150288 RepID=UPI00242EE0E9|nr:TIMELESS-interacting protein [Boleophthalmus pectinirostris]KAJ0056440.1 hypothetical protein NL108_007479 [Boleophthalmus pectinirostris]
MEDDALFDQSRIEDERFDALPPPRSPGEDNADPFGDGENGEVSKLAEVPEAKRKGVKRPQPKLDSNRLTSERGLPALRTLFNNVKFKGKGHEAEDLRLLMKSMENWAHRLFPKLQFEDFMDKVERLGAKKEVQTCLKRIRLDMPLTHEDYTTQEGEEEVPAEMQIFGDPDPFAGEHLSASTPRMTHSTPAPSSFTAQSVDPFLGSSPTSPPSPPSLTEEQQRRMAENRLKALEKRLARQKQQAESQSLESQSTQSEPSESQTKESELVPMEESTEVPPEPDQSPDQVQDMNKDETQDQDQDQDLVTNSSSQPQKTPQTQDTENHVESTPDPKEPEASPSPAPEPEENREEEGQDTKEEE